MKIPKIQKNETNSNLRKIGIEFENPVVDLKGNSIYAEDVQEIFTDLIEKGWDGEKDKLSGNYLELNRRVNGKEVNLSTDCSWSGFEIGMPPTETIKESEEIYIIVLEEINSSAKKFDKRYCGIGMIPGRLDSSDLSKTTKPFYKTLDYLHLHNTNLALNANQVGVDVSLEESVEVVNELIKVSGLVIALCANSSISNYEILPWRDWRVASWQFFSITDYPKTPKLFGFPDKPFESLSDYFKRYLDISPMFIRPIRDTFVMTPKSMSWYDFLTSEKFKSRDLLGKEIEIEPGPQDINVALLNQWPYAKLHIVVDPSKINVGEFINSINENTAVDYLNDKTISSYIEYRIAPATPKGDEFTVSALTLGLVQNIDGLKKLTSKYNWQDWNDFLDEASLRGMSARIQDEECPFLIKELLDIAKKGLESRYLGEEKYLEGLYNRLESKKNPSDVNNEFISKQGPEEFLDFISY